MGRSDSFPAAEPVDSQSSKGPIVRSATTSSQAPTSEADRAKQNAPRPAAPSRQSSVQTRYMGMLLDMDKVPRLHNILSSFFTWILLAGFIIFPGTFTTISGLGNDAAVQTNQTASTVIASVKNIPLLAIAGACTGLGALGMVWLWWYWRHNYVWLLNKIFLCASPSCPSLPIMNRTNSNSSQTRLSQLLRRRHLHAHQRLHPTKRHLGRHGQNHNHRHRRLHDYHGSALRAVQLLGLG
jgi:hypothetical protein